MCLLTFFSPRAPKIFFFRCRSKFPNPMFLVMNVSFFYDDFHGLFLVILNAIIKSVLKIGMYNGLPCLWLNDQWFSAFCKTKSFGNMVFKDEKLILMTVSLLIFIYVINKRSQNFLYKWYSDLNMASQSSSKMVKTLFSTWWKPCALLCLCASPYQPLFLATSLPMQKVSRVLNTIKNQLEL